MKKLLAATFAAMSLALPAEAAPIEESDYHTPHAQGCMIVGDCTDGVERVRTYEELKIALGNDTLINEALDEYQTEIISILESMEAIGVKIYLGVDKYWPPLHRGLYHTQYNNIYLNKRYVTDPNTLIKVLRHEGWHLAQDCMAGTVDNSLIAIIMHPDQVPFIWKDMAENTYPEQVRPWEAEAGWAGHTPGMTADALSTCASPVAMWEEYTPTPLTAQYLRDNNYLK